MDPELSNSAEITQISTFDYRGYSFPIFYDDFSQQYFTFLDGQKIEFGMFNVDYELDIKYLVDKKLDEICQISQYQSAVIE